MGKQANLLLSADDEHQVLSEIMRVAPCMLIRTSSRDPGKTLTLPLKPATASTPLRGLWLAFCLPGARVVCSRGKTGMYSVDFEDSEVVEFRRGRLIDGKAKDLGPAPKTPWLEEGRIWFSERTLMGREKRKAFRDWANTVLRTARRHLESHGYLTYIGPDAKRLARTRRVRLGPP
jgi:hypothetical protein